MLSYDDEKYLKKTRYAAKELLNIAIKKIIRNREVCVQFLCFMGGIFYEEYFTKKLLFKRIQILFESNVTAKVLKMQPNFLFMQYKQENIMIIILPYYPDYFFCIDENSTRNVF